MGWKICVALGAVALFAGACGAGESAPGPAMETAAEPETEDRTGPAETRGTGAAAVDPAVLNRSLEELAELERSGGFTRGMGLTESGIRENAGDYAGAVAAAYKELAWAYGNGLIEKSALEQGLRNVLALGESGEADAAAAAGGILAFMREQWDEAEKMLRSRFEGREEPDGFVRWMLLVCALEQNRDDRQAGAAYRTIRARYGQFPEYWYRGARVFTGTIAAEYAEQCVSIAPAGPFAAECRSVLAVFAGLKSEDGVFLKSKMEIEHIISRSVNQRNPEILAALIPLISLPDNPYTIYALGAMRALAAAPVFRDYFSAQAASSRGRLAERLAYVCRG